MLFVIDSQLICQLLREAGPGVWNPKRVNPVESVVRLLSAMCLAANFLGGTFHELFPGGISLTSLIHGTDRSLLPKGVYGGLHRFPVLGLTGGGALVSFGHAFFQGFQDFARLFFEGTPMFSLWGEQESAFKKGVRDAQRTGISRRAKTAGLNTRIWGFPPQGGETGNWGQFSPVRRHALTFLRGTGEIGATPSLGAHTQDGRVYP